MNSRDMAINETNGEADRGSGIYVDVENLQSDAQAMIQELIEDWPGSIPAPSRVALYVRADQAELWRLWASDRFGDMEIFVHGTQHFSKSSSKNSADIAIATNAMADLTLKRVTHVAVFSDDSDFISLYVAIRDESEVPQADGRVPFLWIVTDRQGSLSVTIKQFFPPHYLHMVTAKSGDAQGAGVTDPSAAKPIRDQPEGAKDTWTEMAHVVLEEIPIGVFKSTDCQPAIKRGWPGHPMATAAGALFGVEFKNNVWPVLQGLGVRIKTPGKKPVQYEMTAEAKSLST